MVVDPLGHTQVQPQAERLFLKKGRQSLKGGTTGEDPQNVVDDTGDPRGDAHGEEQKKIPNPFQRETSHLTYRWLYQVGLYILCSSCMLVVNKASVMALPYSYTVTALQTGSSAVLLLAARALGFLSFPVRPCRPASRREFALLVHSCLVRS